MHNGMHNSMQNSMHNDIHSSMHNGMQNSMHNRMHNCVRGQTQPRADAAEDESGRRPERSTTEVTKDGERKQSSVDTERRSN